MIRRLRRLRSSPKVRDLVGSVRLLPSDFVLPVFVKEDIAEPEASELMPGVLRHTVPSALSLVKEAVSAGVRGVILFGVTNRKDAQGTRAWAKDGIVQQAARAIKDALQEEVVLFADLCLDEYTDHGHCGVLDERGEVDNDATLELYARTAVSQAEAGVDFVAPSGMMDGQVAAIRSALDEAGHPLTGILAYSAKYASSFYGPFRDVVEVTISKGDRRGYQMDFRRDVREAVAEVLEDVEEGADIVMVKPALPYLDILSAVVSAVDVPVAAYQVSGEYAMLRGAMDSGALAYPDAMLESLSAIKRAGADFILTYFAKEAAELVSQSL